MKEVTVTLMSAPSVIIDGEKKYFHIGRLKAFFIIFAQKKELQEMRQLVFSG